MERKSDYLDDAVEWARLATEICIPDLLSEYLNTYACLLYQTDRRDEAVRIAEIAVRSLTEEQKKGFMGQKVRVDYELMKKGRLTSEQEWIR